MAQGGGVVLDRDQFNCSICLDVLKDPVTIPCGHSYCSGCIQRYWDQDDYLGVYGCPQCRQTFNPRPLPGRNTMLADVVERLRNTRLHGRQEETSGSAAAARAAAGEPSLAGPEDVACDVCTPADGRKNKAVKSCLVCLASYCDAHLQPHYESAAFKKHKLVPASQNLQETICHLHDKLLEVYCRTDKQCICYLCLTHDHKGHDTVLAETEVEERQAQLVEMKRNSEHRIQRMDNEVKELQQAIMSFTRSTRTTIDECDKLFTALIHSIELKRFEVREMIRAQQKTAVGQAERVLEKLQKGMTELKERDAELEKLSQTEDHINFLQSCQSLQVPPVLEVEAFPLVSTDTSFTFGPVMTAVSSFKDLLQEVCQSGFVSIYEKVREVTIIDCPTPSIQQERQESAQPNEQTIVQMDSTQVIPTPGLDQSPVNPLNPFLTPGPTIPAFGGFVFSPFGNKLSSGSRQRSQQRRSYSRRK